MIKKEKLPSKNDVIKMEDTVGWSKKISSVRLALLISYLFLSLFMYLCNSVSFLMVRVKAHELREKNESDLLGQLEDLKSELAQLRVAKVSGGASAKLAKIKQVRKGIARVLTVHNEKRRAVSKAEFSGKSLKPLDQRKKLTREKRRAMTPGQLAKTTKRVQTRLNNFPNRRYAVMA